jgi:repressor LexA
VADVIERRPLTARQQEVLDWVDGFINTHGYSPTIQQIAHAFTWTKAGAACHLNALRRKGWINWVDGESRTIRLVGGVNHEHSNK